MTNQVNCFDIIPPNENNLNAPRIQFFFLFAIFLSERQRYFHSPFSLTQIAAQSQYPLRNSNRFSYGKDLTLPFTWRFHKDWITRWQQNFTQHKLGAGSCKSLMSMLRFLHMNSPNSVAHTHASILSPFQSGNIPELKLKGTGHMTFQVSTLLPLLLREGEWPFLCNVCGKPIKLWLMDRITHVSDQSHQSFHDQALTSGVSPPIHSMMQRVLLQGERTLGDAEQKVTFKNSQQGNFTHSGTSAFCICRHYL